MKRRFWFGKAIMILVCITAFVMLFSFIVMSLWNGVLHEVVAVKTITFWPVSYTHLTLPTKRIV